MEEKLRQLKQKLTETGSHAAAVAADAADTVGAQAQNLMTVGRLRLRRSELERQVNEQLRRVGEMVYATHTGHPTDSDALVAQLRAVDETNAELTAVRARLIAAQGGRVCGCCGTPAKAGDVFCGECGQPLE